MQANRQCNGISCIDKKRTGMEGDEIDESRPGWSMKLTSRVRVDTRCIEHVVHYLSLKG